MGAGKDLIFSDKSEDSTPGAGAANSSKREQAEQLITQSINEYLIQNRDKLVEELRKKGLQAHEVEAALSRMAVSLKEVVIKEANEKAKSWKPKQKS